MRVISSLEKGLKVLEYVAQRGSVRLAETARRFDMSNSNMSIFMNTLVKTGYVHKDDAERRYFVSTKIQRLSTAADSHTIEFIELVAKGEMQALHEEFNENVMLAVLSGNTSRYVARIQSNHLIQIVDDDQTYPLHATANGKVILAFKDPQFVSRYLESAEWRKYTDLTISSREALRQELHEIRERGFAINRGEYEDSIMAVAVPIAEDGTIVASLVVQYPTFRHDAEDLEEYGPVLVKAAKRISARLNSFDAEGDLPGETRRVKT